MTQLDDSPTPATMSEPMQPDDDSDRLEDDGEWVSSPIDDPTYDLLMALASKLEAIDTYRVYAGDGNADLWRELADDEGRHAERLFGELKQRIAAS